VDPDVAQASAGGISNIFCAPQHEQILPGSDYASSAFDAAHNKILEF
jgi:hypothetical protein